MHILDLKNISIRGRVAFTISILENALNKGQDVAQWNILLAQLWKFTDAKFLDQWHEETSEFVPSSILEDLEYSQKGFQYLNEPEYMHLRNLYGNAQPFITELVEGIFHLGTIDLYGDLTNNSVNTLDELEKIIVIANTNAISLPDYLAFNQFE